MKVKNRIFTRFTAATLLLAAFSSSFVLADNSLATLVAAISFTDVITSILAVGVLAIGVDLALMGYMKIRGIVKRA